MDFSVNFIIGHLGDDFYDLVFLLVTANTFLLLCVSSNFLLGAGYCEGGVGEGLLWLPSLKMVSFVSAGHSFIGGSPCFEAFSR